MVTRHRRERRRRRTFDQACLDAYEAGAITEETALLYCSKRGPVTRGIDNIKKARGESTTTVIDLRMKTTDSAKPAAAPVPAMLKLK